MKIVLNDGEIDLEVNGSSVFFKNGTDERFFEDLPDNKQRELEAISADLQVQVKEATQRAFEVLADCEHQVHS